MNNPDRLVSAAHDHWRVVDHEIRNLQKLLGVEPDGFIGPLTRAAAAKKGGVNAVSNRELLTAIETMETKIMATIDEILAKQATALQKIQANTDLDASIKALVESNTATITDLRAQLAAAGTDPVKLQTLADGMDAIIAAQDADTAASAVVANTPPAETSNL